MDFAVCKSTVKIIHYCWLCSLPYLIIHNLFTCAGGVHECVRHTDTSVGGDTNCHNQVFSCSTV